MCVRVRTCVHACVRVCVCACVRACVHYLQAELWQCKSYRQGALWVWQLKQTDDKLHFLYLVSILTDHLTVRQTQDLTLDQTLNLNLEVDLGQYSRHPHSAGGCCWSSPVGFWSLEWPVSPQKCPSCPPEVSLKTQANNRKLWQESWNQDPIRPGPEQTLSIDQHLFDLKLYIISKLHIIRKRFVTEEAKEIRQWIQML